MAVCPMADTHRGGGASEAARLPPYRSAAELHTTTGAGQAQKSTTNTAPQKTATHTQKPNTHKYKAEIYTHRNEGKQKRKEKKTTDEGFHDRPHSLTQA